MNFYLLLIIFLILTIPGWTFLAVTKIWRFYSVLQRWLIAISLSIVFYPILFYGIRFIFPSFQLGIHKLAFMLFIFTICSFVFLRKEIRKQFKFVKSEWIAILILVFTFLGRYFLASKFPYPAWTDSLHHTLLTYLTAISGKLPFTLEPFMEVPLDSYHLGLYSLTGVVEMLSNAPAHIALQWTMQTLSALCGMGIYLILDRKAGRKAAIAGLLIASLISFQPNWYFNWGRYTQLASQVIFLAAWMFTWDTLEIAVSPKKQQNLYKYIFASSALNAGVFLLHFRVAVFYFPLILLTIAYCIWKNSSSKKALTWIAITTFSIATISTIIILPVFLPFINIYNQPRLSVLSMEALNTNSDFYSFSFQSFLAIGIKLPLLIFTFIFSIFSFLRDWKWTVILYLWIFILIGMANIYRLDISILSFTNAGAIYIMFYIPASLLIGSGTEFLYKKSTLVVHTKDFISILIILVVCLIYLNQRIHDIEPYRWFITETDLNGMNWINQNTDPNAVFGVNTYFWLPESPHGTDGGYWIPYFTNRKTNTGVMLNDLGSLEYRKEIVYRSLAMEAVAQDSNNAFELCEQGIDYIFIGEKGDFSGNGLDKTKLTENPMLEVVFENGATSILHINCP